MHTVERGRRGEAIAAAYLELQGYVIRRRNVRLGRKEIDLVASLGRTLAFVEVKTRMGGGVDAALGAAGRDKRRHVLTGLGEHLGALRRAGWRPRFDIVAIAIEPRAHRLTLRHYPGVWRPPVTPALE